MSQRSTLGCMTVLLALSLVACGGSSDPGPTTPGPGGTSGPGTTGGPGATQPTGGSDSDDWVEVDGTRYGMTTTQCSDADDDFMEISTFAEGIGPVLVEVRRHSVDFVGEPTDLEIFAQLGYTGPEGSLYSEYGYTWVGLRSLPVRGAEVSIDGSRIKAGPIPLREEGFREPVLNVLSFDFETPEGCDVGWARVSASTPPGPAYARFEFGDEVVEFDESQFRGCQVNRGLSVEGPDTVMTDDYPTFSLLLMVDDTGALIGGNLDSVEVLTDRMEGWSVGLISITSGAGDGFGDVEVTGRRATGTADFMVLESDPDNRVVVRGSFDVSCD